MAFIGRVAHGAYCAGVCASLAATCGAAAQLPPVVVPPNAVLPNYERIPLAGRESIEAGAFVARTNDAAANWYNPAGLAQHKESAVNASATAYEWTRMRLAGPGVATDRATFKTVGTFFGVLLGDPPLRSDRWRLGVSLTRPLAWRPGRTDAAFSFSTPDGQELFTFSSDVDLSSLVPAASVAYAPRGVGKSPIRFGATFSVPITSLWQTQSLTDRLTSASSLTTRLRTSATDGTATHLALTGGLQWDLSSHATAGLRIVSPGIQVWGSTRIKIQGSESSGTSLADLTFRDESAEFKYAIPFQADIGLTVRFARGEIEADVHYHGAADQYVLYSSDTLAQATQVVGGTPPVVSSLPFTSTYAAVRAVANVAIAGNYRIGRLMRVHLGVLTDRSPVPTDSSSVFTKVDLYRVTSGFSLTGASLSGSIGLAYGWGRGNDRSLVVTAGGLPGQTRLEVRTLNFIYALSYAF